MYWSIWVGVVVTLFITSITHWVYKWMNPKCNGKLPPGSMGLPLIGETIQFFIPSKSLDVSNFIKKRMKKYGPLFCTNLVGRPVVVSSDPDFNYYIFQQEGRLVELWYLDSFARLVGQDASQSTAASGYVHKYLRNLVLAHFGNEVLKDKLLGKAEEMIRERLHGWSKLPELEMKSSISSMIFDFTAKELFSYDFKEMGENFSERFTNIIQALISFPLNVPGTTFHKCLKNQKEAIKLIRDVLKERKASPPENRKGDFLDQLIDDMKKETFLSDDFIVLVMFGLLLASFETISATITLAVKFLTENPIVFEELIGEHETILKNRENQNSGISWKEYKSMTFTHQVINEALRLASVAPGILRRAIKDIEVNGYTIPAGWTIMVVPAALQLNPNTYVDPLTFNPWRWKDMGAGVAAKNFIAFGGGSRSCAGADFTKVLMATFFHVLVTNYRLTKIKGGEISRSPALTFRSGFHIKMSKKLP